MTLSQTGHHLSLKSFLQKSTLWTALLLFLLTFSLLVQAQLSSYETSVFFLFWSIFIILILTNGTHIISKVDQPSKAFENLLICGYACLLSVKITEYNNATSNSLEVVMKIIQIVVILATSYYVIRNSKMNNYDEESIYRGWSKIVLIVCTLFMAGKMYEYFSTKFDWILGFSLTILIFFYFKDRRINNYWGWRDKSKERLIIFLPLIIAFSSTIYQFREIEVFSGWNLGQVGLMIGATLVFIFIIWIYVSLVDLVVFFTRKT